MLFTFFAKQGQEVLVVDLLTKFGNPNCEIKHDGVLISVDLPNGVSKRSVNRLLFHNLVPGSQSKRNKFRVLKAEKWDNWKIEQKIGYNKPFILSNNGRLEKVKLIDRTTCDCCGPIPELVSV